mmetsp:Transcript_47171/g.119605  ORF Transcript_47171/g.119605 Transcript_47171/m.119605 type:complete len:315 (-) Transcript_47171:104-1048(-)
MWMKAALVVMAYALWCQIRRRWRRMLEEKEVVLVTGCDSGFGLAIVKALLKHTKVSVIAGAVTKQGLKGLEELGSRVKAVEMDVTKDEHVDKVFKDLEASGKPLVGVVNNAGIGVYGWAEALPFQRYEANLQVNLLGVIRVTKKALPFLRKSRGRLVTMGSLGCRCPSAFGSAYIPTKAAVASFQDCVRQEVYRFGIRCSLVEPGFFATGMLHRAAEIGKEACGTANGGEDPAILAAYGSYAEKMKTTEVPVQNVEKLNGGEQGIEWVTGAVLDALTTVLPRTRYLCGYDANLLGRLGYFIPDFAWDLIQTYLV